MNILYILPSLANTAPIRIVLLLAEYCTSCGHFVEVNYFDDKKELTFPCKVKQISINKAIEFDEYDIIHSHLRRPDEYVAKNSNQIKRAKTISTIHCDIYADLLYSYGQVVANLYTKKWLNNLKRFNITVQVSEFLMKKYRYTLDNNYLIHNGVSIISQEICEYAIIKEMIDYFHNNGYKVMLSYSNIIKRKGLNQIINAMVYKSDLAYICVGDGKEKTKLIKLVKKYGLENRVMFVDFIDYPYNLIPYVDLMVVPSYSESFCLSLHEAGLVGASVICSDIPAFSDAFSEKEVSFFQLDNVDSFLKAVHDGLNIEKKEKLKIKESELYTTDKMVKEYISLYNKVTKL